MSGAGTSELKLELTRDELQRVDAHPALANLTVGQPHRRTLRSIYFDTPDHRLRAEGISLRLQADGERWLQMVKANSQDGNGAEPEEVALSTTAGPEPDVGAIEDRKVRRKVEKAVRRSVLEPVFETVVTRTVRKLFAGEGQLELALDDGIVRAGQAERALCEAELGLKTGSPQCLLETAAQLFAASAVRLAGASNSDRGYELLLGKSGKGSEPRRSEPVSLHPGDSCAEALARIAQSATLQILANREAVIETDDPEAAHQLRIGLRRLRSALRAFRSLHATPATRELEAHAKAVARAVGELRDADVLIDDIYASVAGSLKTHPGLGIVREALMAHRADVRERVRAALGGKAWSALQLYLALWPRTIEPVGVLSEPVGDFAHCALAKGWKKVARLGKKLDKLDTEQRHDMRKALKMLRYEAEFFSSLYDAQHASRFVRRLKDLQDVSGYVNDVATAERLSDICHERCAGSREAQRVAGYILGWHNAEAARAWASAGERWKKLTTEKPFWQ